MTNSAFSNINNFCVLVVVNAQYAWLSCCMYHIAGVKRRQIVIHEFVWLSAIGYQPFILGCHQISQVLLRE